MSSYVVAVSGGVDSVVLLDILAKAAEGTSASRELQAQAPSFIVAHFDHGIRPDSAKDAAFVRNLAKKYGLPFETVREELGPNASEKLARNRRYVFLRGVAKKHNAKIMTAHHADDVIETIAINLTRGTGWRGLAVLDSPDIERPLLDTAKKQLLDYAKTHGLEWHEDSTNQDTTYLRNDLRQKLAAIDSETTRLLQAYRSRQLFLRKEIDTETDRLVGASPYRRSLFIMVPHVVAMELLRAVFIKEYGWAPTRPQLSRALLMIKTLQAGKSHDVTSGARLRFTRTHFVVEPEPKMVK